MAGSPMGHVQAQAMLPLSETYRIPTPELRPYPFDQPGLGLFLQKPRNIRIEETYDADLNRMTISEYIGPHLRNAPPFSMPYPEFRTFDLQRKVAENWYQSQRSSSVIEEHVTDGLIAPLYVNSPVFDKVFGTNVINIVPQGSAETVFSLKTSKTDNPNLTERARKTTTFDFDTNLQMNVTGTIGDKLRMSVNYNTQSSFEFDNEFSITYTGNEDEILRKVEAGNVSFAVPGSLITGSQSLFGLRTDMQFGRLSVSTVLSQQKSEFRNMTIKGDRQLADFEMTADNYDANRHFFLSQFFRDHYEQALAGLPVVNSGIAITRIEVWVTNKTTDYTNSRNIVAFTDLGESSHIYNTMFRRSSAEQPPQNDTTGQFNTLYPTLSSRIRDINAVTSALGGYGLQAGMDYEKLQNARLLNSTEYTLNAQLGYISLNTAMAGNEVLAVAYEYTYRGRTYKVGELSSSGVPSSQVLIAKLLKPTNLSPRSPLWALMMKNIYALPAYQFSAEDFDLQIRYQDDVSGNALDYIPEPEVEQDLLLRMLQLDRMNSQKDPYPDGVFDFVDGVTVQPSKGRIVFPVLEPFGSTLRAYLASKGIDAETVDRYVFEALYDSTLTQARLLTEKNKFMLQGTYQASSGSEIYLNAYNIPEGSVKVTAGSSILTEGVDYTVDYLSGRIVILNQSILNSGANISVSLENNSLYDVQSKTFIGTHFDYQFSEHFNFGATVLRLSERPLTQKVNLGSEPMSNTMVGFNTSFDTSSDWLTRLINKWPTMRSTTRSRVSFEGEFAGLIPGSSNTLQHKQTSYIDDFESSESSYDLKTFAAWHLASIPQHNRFAEAMLNNDLTTGMNRAHIAWYVIDPLFVNKNYFTSSTPSHIRNDADTRSSHFVTPVYEEDIFKNREHLSGESTLMTVLNVAYYPRERGQYNFETSGTAYSAGVNPDGSLKDPASRWGGIMRQMTSTNFEASNIESLEFWLMDPFVEDPSAVGGDLYFHFGNISEDILKDGRKAYENGLPTSSMLTGVDSTSWGYIPQAESLVNAFTQGAISQQDVGLDGMSDVHEQHYFSAYLQRLASMVNARILSEAEQDPAKDNFRYPRSAEWDRQQAGILQRYKFYNGVQGNSAVSGYTNSGLPSVEDINGDNTLNETEGYYQYHVSLRPEDLQEVGKNFIVDIVPNHVTFPNGTESTVNWYQFRIPIDDYEDQKGSIDGFSSIQFMRMVLTGFQDSVFLRFATMDLIRSEWRKYTLPLDPTATSSPITADDPVLFETGTLNIEDNAGKSPVGYVLPPGFDRAVNQSSNELQQLNEQSMMLKIKELPNGDARAVYRTVAYDLRRYKHLKMEVHAEQLAGSNLADGEMTVFLRLGSDARNNYYEYEVPLQLTPWGAVDPEKVWPELNAMDIVLDYFVEAKQARNEAMKRAGSQVTLNSRYVYRMEEEEFVVVGNPNLGQIKTIMIGVRYPYDQAHAGETRSVEVWVNELRLSDFSNEGGWAARGRLVASLADFATISLSGSSQSPGFGSIDTKVRDRSTDYVKEYALGVNVELGKMLPERIGLQLPVYAGYSEKFVTPEYDPQNPDVKLREALRQAGSRAARDSIRNYSEDYTRHRNLTLTNIRIAPPDARDRFYSVSNFTWNYAFYETYHRDVTTAYQVSKQFKGSMMYDYTFPSNFFTPFKDVQWMKGKWWRLVREFNWNPYPSRISFRTEMSRDYSEKQLRNLSSAQSPLTPSVDKNFLWNRDVELSWDLTRSVKIDFSSQTRARIDEPEGVVKKSAGDAYDRWRDSVLYNIRHLGRTTTYAQQLYASYNLPINKLPYLDWLSSSVTYNAEYQWDAAPVTSVLQGVKYDPGNTITNSQRLTYNGIVNLLTLYNRSPYLRQLTNPMMQRPGEDKERQVTYKKVVYERVKVNFTGGRDRYVTHNLKTQTLTVEITGPDGTAYESDVQVISDNRIAIRTRENVSNATLKITGSVPKRATDWDLLKDNAIRIVMGLRDVSVYYTQNGSTVLPGYTEDTRFLGIKAGAPGLPFVLGWQDELFADKAARRGWLTQDTSLIQEYGLTMARTLNLRATYIPFNGLTIQLRGSRTMAQHQTAYFVFENGTYPEAYRNPVKSGSFSISVVSLKTSFESPKASNGYRSEAFDRFVAYRSTIAERRAEAMHRTDPSYDRTAYSGDGGTNGYGLLSQDVLIPAFFAAYTGRSPHRVSLSYFPSLTSLRPNWDLSWDGLRDLSGFLEKKLKSINIRHAYSSLYSIGNYTSNADFVDVRSAVSRARDMQYNFIPEYDIATVSIAEQYTPLIGVDFTTESNVSARFEVRKSRTVTLSLTNLQISENQNNETVMSLGYTFDHIPVFLRNLSGTVRSVDTQLVVDADLSVRDTKSFIRRIAEVPQASSGQRVVTLGMAARYVMNQNLTMRVFYDRVVNDPFVSSSYRTSNSSFGFSLQFLLTE